MPLDFAAGLSQLEDRYFPYGQAAEADEAEDRGRLALRDASAYTLNLKCMTSPSWTT